MIFWFLLSEDAAGVPYSQDRALETLREASAVPVFGMGDYELGRGIIGGPLMQTQALGQQAAAVALRILKGERPRSINPPPVLFGAPMYDWRELRRWGISEDRLPAGGIVQFRGPTLWQQYRWLILLVAGTLVAQTLVIGYVLVQNRRRRAAELSFKESEERMTFTAASANVGLWQFDRASDQLWATEHCRALFGLAKDAPLVRDTLLGAITVIRRIAMLWSLGSAAPETCVILPPPTFVSLWRMIKSAGFAFGHAQIPAIGPRQIG